jgi:hypothetical protein
MKTSVERSRPSPLDSPSQDIGQLYVMVMMTIHIGNISNHIREMHMNKTFDHKTYFYKAVILQLHFHK